MCISFCVPFDLNISHVGILSSFIHPVQARLWRPRRPLAAPVNFVKFSKIFENQPVFGMKIDKKPQSAPAEPCRHPGPL